MLKNTIVRQILIYFALMSILFIAFHFLNRKIKDVRNRDFAVVNDNYSWNYEIEKISEVGDTIQIDGWSFELEQNAEGENFDIILYDMDNEEYHFAKMFFFEREDVNNYFLCEYDYTKSGFSAVFDIDKSRRENGTFEILVRPQGLKKAFKTGVYLTERTLKYVNPEAYFYLDTKGTALDTIVKNGVLRAYNHELGVYVFQYGMDLYWITDGKSILKSNGSTYIQYQLWTTQKEKLPQHRLEHNWFSDSLSFVFEENEIEELRTERYRVSKQSIPVEYAVTKIETGYYTTGVWIWQCHFRPIHGLVSE